MFPWENVPSAKTSETTCPRFYCNYGNISLSCALIHIPWGFPGFKLTWQWWGAGLGSGVTMLPEVCVRTRPPGCAVSMCCPTPPHPIPPQSWMTRSFVTLLPDACLHLGFVVVVILGRLGLWGPWDKAPGGEGK